MSTQPQTVVCDPLSQGDRHLAEVVDTERRRDSCYPWFVVRIDGSRYRAGHEDLLAVE